MPKKHTTKQLKPSSDPNVAAFDVVARLTGTKPTKKRSSKAPVRRGAAKKP